MGQTIPTYYVVPQQRFDTRTFVNLAEIEFPTFFNFFVLKKRVQVCVQCCARTFCLLPPCCLLVTHTFFVLPVYHHCCRSQVTVQIVPRGPFGARGAH